MNKSPRLLLFPIRETFDFVAPDFHSHPLAQSTFRPADMTPWWKPEKGASVAWLGIFLPGLLCFLHFLMLHLNQYPEVEGSEIRANVQGELDKIIPPGATVSQAQ